MKVTVTSTSQIFSFGATITRLWEGKTENGTPVRLYTAHVGVEQSADPSELTGLHEVDVLPSEAHARVTNLANDAHALCQAIELLPASEQRTALAWSASALHERLQMVLNR